MTTETLHNEETHVLPLQPAEPSSALRKRRWWQFSVRTMLVLVALIAITAGTVIPWVRSSIAQRNFAATSGSQLWVEVVYHRPADPLNPITAWFVDKLGPDFVWPLKEITAFGQSKDLHLQTLDLSKLEKIELGFPILFDWNLLRRMPRLKDLKIYGLQAQDFADISYCTQLKKLRISNTDINDFSQLECLGQLEELFLGSCKVCNLAPITKLKNLWKLNLANNPAVDFSPLAKCDQLQELSLFATKFEDTIILRGCVNLQKLDLGCTNVRDIQSLMHLPQLEDLDIGSTEVFDFKPLAKCVKLKSLDCSHTSISDLTPLKNCQQLESLNIRGTRVTDLQPLKEMKSLRRLKLPDDLYNQLGASRLKQLFPDCIVETPPISDR